MDPNTRWDESMPSAYARHLGPALFAPWGAHVAQRVADLGPQRVLEVAAGSGVVTAELVRRLPGVEVIATDLNEAMVRLGAIQVPHARWQAADAQQLPFPDAYADVVVCQFGIMFVPDKRRAFAEMARVLTSAGHALVPIWDTLSTSPMTEALVLALEAVLGADRPDFVERVPHGYTDPAVIRADAQAGGLRVHELERIALTGHATSAASLAAGFCYGTPLRFQLLEHGPLDELAARIAAEMSARLGDGPVSGPLTAHLLVAGPA